MILCGKKTKKSSCCFTYLLAPNNDQSALLRSIYIYIYMYTHVYTHTHVHIEFRDSSQKMPRKRGKTCYAHIKGLWPEMLVDFMDPFFLRRRNCRLLGGSSHLVSG